MVRAMLTREKKVSDGPNENCKNWNFGLTLNHGQSGTQAARELIIS